MTSKTSPGGRCEKKFEKHGKKENHSPRVLKVLQVTMERTSTGDTTF